MVDTEFKKNREQDSGVCVWVCFPSCVLVFCYPAPAKILRMCVCVLLHNCLNTRIKEKASVDCVNKVWGFLSCVSGCCLAVSQVCMQQQQQQRKKTCILIPFWMSVFCISKLKSYRTDSLMNMWAANLLRCHEHSDV